MLGIAMSALLTQDIQDLLQCAVPETVTFMGV